MNSNQRQQQEIQLIAQLLEQSVSPDQIIRRNAGQQLLQFQKLPGFCFILTAIVEDVRASEHVRQAAALLLKNTVRELWRNVQASEQEQVRERVLRLCLQEENAKLWPTLHAILAWSIWWDVPSDTITKQLTRNDKSPQKHTSVTLSATRFTQESRPSGTGSGSGSGDSISVVNPLHTLAEHGYEASSDVSWMGRSVLRALLDAIQQAASAASAQNVQARLAALRGMQALREALLYLIPCRFCGDVAPNYPPHGAADDTTRTSSPSEPEDDEWLLGKRRCLQTVSLSMFAMMATLWGNSMQALISVLGAVKNGQQSGEILGADGQYVWLTQYVLTVTRILRLFLLAYVPHFVRHNAQASYSVLSGFLNSLKTLSSFCKAYHRQQPLLTRNVWKLVVLLSRTLSNLQQVHPLTCAPLLSEMATFCKTELVDNAGMVTSEEEINHHEKYLVQLMTLLSNILTTPEYTEPVAELRQRHRSRSLAVDMREEVDERLVSQARQALGDTLSSSALFDLVKLLLMHYMRLSPRELRLWETDPEGFVDEILGELYQQRLGPCAEYLYIVVLRSTSTRTLANQVVDLIRNTLLQLSQQQQFSQETILLKDSCYWALAAAYNSLCEVVDFESLLRDILLRELQVTHPAYKIIRRRVAHVIESWVMSAEHKPQLQNTIFQVCIPLLGDSDLVVRFYAVVALRNLIDDVDLRQPEVQTLIEPMIRGIVTLVNDMHDSATCVQVLHLLSVILMNLGNHVRRFVDTILKCVSGLWQTSRQPLLQAAILSVLASLVEALDSADVIKLYPQLQSVLTLSVDVQSPAFLHLHDEGLHLWFNILQQIPSNSPADTITRSLLDLFAKLPAILDRSSDKPQQHESANQLLQLDTQSSSSANSLTQPTTYDGHQIQEVMHVLHAYLLWGGTTLVEQHLAAVTHLFTVAAESSTRGPKMETVLATLTTFLQMFPTQAPRVLLPVFKRLLLSLFRYFKDNEVGHIIVTLLSRVLLHAPDIFSQLFQEFSTTANSSTSSSSLFTQYIQLWLNKAPTLTYIDQLTLTVLGLSTLLVNNDAAFVSTYGVSIVETCTTCLTKRQTEVNSPRHSDSLSYEHWITKFIWRSPAAIAKERLIANDPLLNADPVRYFLAKLDESFKLHGQAWQDYLTQHLRSETTQLIKSFRS